MARPFKGELSLELANKYHQDGKIIGAPDPHPPKKKAKFANKKPAAREEDEDEVDDDDDEGEEGGEEEAQSEPDLVKPHFHITPGHDNKMTIVIRTEGADKVQLLEVKNDQSWPRCTPTQACEEIVKALEPLIKDFDGPVKGAELLK